MISEVDIENFFLYNTIANDLVSFIIVVMFISSFIHRANRTILGSWIANIFGVVFHEIAHYIVGKIMNAKPIKFSLLPHKEVTPAGEKMYVLGHVDFQNLKWYNAVPTALAPFLLIFIAYWIEDNFWIYFDKTGLNLILFIYLMVVFITNCIPSEQDFKVAFSNAYGLVFWFVVIPFGFIALYRYLQLYNLIT